MWEGLTPSVRSRMSECFILSCANRRRKAEGADSSTVAES